MRRTQLYLDDQLWNALHSRARREDKTVSELMREAVRKRYVVNLEELRQAMEAFVGVRRSPRNSEDSTEYVRSLRRDGRIRRLHGK